MKLWINTREPVVSQEYYDEIYARAMALVPSFDQSTLMPRLTQGDMCTYADLPADVSAIQEYIAAHTF